MANPPAPAPRNQPAHEVRLGTIKAAIWQNDTDAGVRFNVTFERLYREGQGWQSTSSFGRDDLLVLAKVADLAHSWIMEPDATEGKTSQRSGRDAGTDLSSKSLPRRSGTAKGTGA
jgi:hypothetical protein